MKTILLSISVVLLSLANSGISLAQESSTSGDSEKLVMLWISDDIDAAEKMAFMYAHTAKKAGWFQEVTVIIWGPSAKLVSENEKLQEKVKAMQADGIKVEACVACARQYGVDGKLRELGYDVKGMGTHLTNYLKSDAKVISF
ncbi:MAG: DsrE family protein [Bacteroidetes bacterium]|nr:DsrE family protein [Bacteroidota bacterium]